MDTKTWRGMNKEQRIELLRAVFLSDDGPPAMRGYILDLSTREWPMHPRWVRIGINKFRGETTKRTPKTFETMRDTQFDLAHQNDQRFGGTLDETGE